MVSEITQFSRVYDLIGLYPFLGDFHNGPFNEITYSYLKDFSHMSNVYMHHL
jgi:hypothetical protein